MSGEDKFVLAPSLTIHAWNKDRTMVAVSPNTKKIFIYEVKGEKLQDWGKPKYILAEHDQPVTGIDWSSETNQILSCSQDRNAYVWTLTENKWKPSLVLLRINRAATCCKWSQNGKKFAVGSAAKEISVCYFEQENDWWVAKMIKKGIKSTISDLAWSPVDPSILAFGGTDKKFRLVDAYIKSADGKKKRKSKFGSILSEIKVSAWVKSIDFSPNGEICAFTTNDSKITLVNPENGELIAELRYNSLPFRSIKFLSNNSIIAGGFDHFPVAFCNIGGSWKCVGNVDIGKKEESGPKKAAFRSAFMRFQQQGSQSPTGGVTAAKKHQSRHHNDIVSIQPFKISSEGNVEVFTTSSLDGTVLFWKIDDIKKNVEEFTL